jgi:uncharacterized BrkB/YihY/UPF0761 family membrane protein
VVNSRRFPATVRNIAIAYGMASLFVLAFGLPILVSVGLYPLVVLLILLGPLGSLHYLAIDPGSMLLPTLTLYVSATALLAVCLFFLSRHKNRGVRIAASCVAAVIWIASGYVTLMGELYG